MAAMVAVDQVDPCPDGGQLRLTGELQDRGTGTLEVRYEDCREGNITTDGIGTYRIDKYSREDGVIDGTTTYTALTFTGPGTNMVVSGSIRALKFVSPATWGEQYAVDLVVQNRVDGIQLWYHPLLIQSGLDWSYRPTPVWEEWSGRVYDSAEGYVEVRTLDPLRYVDFGFDYPERGQAAVLGATGEMTIWPEAHGLVRLQMDAVPESRLAFSASLPWEDLAQEPGANLADTDGDGLHDSWEQYYGLDPSNPGDLDGDADRDGFTNAEEHAWGTKPDDPSSTPPSVDLSLSVSPVELSAPALESVRYTITVRNVGTTAAPNARFVHELPAGTRLMYFNPVGWYTWTCEPNQATALHCTRESLPPGFVGNLEVTAAVPREVGIHLGSAEISSEYLDSRREDNRLELALDVRTPRVDLVLAMEKDRAEVEAGGTVLYTLRIRNEGRETAPNAALSFELPPDSSILPGAVGLDSCEGETTLRCAFGDLRPFLDFRVLTVPVFLRSGGLLHAVASVTSEAEEQRPFDNRWVDPILVGPIPEVSLQDRIDAASPGETILVGPGVYQGDLDFRGKALRLVSAEGPEQTFLTRRGPVPLRLGSGAELRGFTILNSGRQVAVYAEGNSLVAENVFEGNRTTAVMAVGARTAGNIFRYNHCSDGMGGLVEVSGERSSPEVVNNLFFSNTCLAIWTRLWASSASIMNNTMAGNARGVDLRRLGPQTSIVFRNNLIIGNGRGFEASGDVGPFFPTWDHNLVFGNFVDFVEMPDPTGANGNLSVDPLFLDSAAGDFRLSAGSPAIDAGSTEGAPTLDIEGSTRWVDGNGDGVAYPDLGAYEAH